MTSYTLFSAGAGSFKTAKRVQASGGDHRLVFADTLYEDADAYRFLIEAAANVFGRSARWVPPAEDFPDYRVDLSVPLDEYAGNPAWRRYLDDLRLCALADIPELIWLVEGRDPWEIYRDERFLGNARVDPCSKFLKREVLDAWRLSSCDPERDVFFVGIGEHEAYRFDDGEGHGVRPRMAALGWTYEAPLSAPTPANMENPLNAVQREGLAPPRLYAAGYAHNNCGGFCCKAGLKHWANRARVQPDRYDYDAAMIAKFTAWLGPNAYILRDRRGGVTRPLDMVEFARQERTSPDPALELLDDGGCGCAVDA